MIAASKWMYRGLTNYTKSSFDRKQKTFIDDHAKIGQVCIVTGANSGIGYAAVVDFAKRGCRVHMVCRNRERGEKALESAKVDSNSENIFLHICDVSLTSDTTSFVKSYMESGERLDVLVLNAGVMMAERTTTPEGFETTFATNLLAPYLMTKLFLPLLINQKPIFIPSTTTRPDGTTLRPVQFFPRVIFVSSGGMLTQKMYVKDLQFNNLDGSKWNHTTTYAQTKRALVFLTEAFVERNGGRGNIQFYSMHPGWVDTPQLENAMPTFHWATKGILRTSEQGCDTITWLGMSGSVQQRQENNGEFFEDREIVPKHLTELTESSFNDLAYLWSYLGEQVENVEKSSKKKLDL